jgi:hypothetical protein
MRKIIFNEKEYDIPESWQDVSLRSVIKYDQLLEILPDAPIVAMISAYSGIPVDELKTSRMPDINEIMIILNGFLRTPYEPQINNEFEYKSQLYRMNDDILDMEFQDWISIQTILYNNRDNTIFGLPKIIAVLAKHVGERLDDYNLDERANELLDMPFTKAKDLEFFFSTNVHALQQLTQSYSIRKEQEKYILQQFLELNNIMQKRKGQHGISLPTRWLIGAYQIYLRYLRKRLEKSFNSTLTEASKNNFKAIVRSRYINLFKGNKNEPGHSG